MNSASSLPRATSGACDAPRLSRRQMRRHRDTPRRVDSRNRLRDPALESLRGAACACARFRIHAARIEANRPAGLDRGLRDDRRCEQRASGEPRHAIAMHGEPALPAGFAHLRYVNPAAPKGGRLVHGMLGTFDSLNPFIVKGLRDPRHSSPRLRDREPDGARLRRAVHALRPARRTVETDDARTYVTFTLDPAARFSDGRPVTADDVVFSWQLLRDKGRPNHRTYYSKVAKAEVIGERAVRFDLAGADDRELPLILGLMPVLPKHAIDPDTFEQTRLTPLDRQRALHASARSIPATASPCGAIRIIGGATCGGQSRLLEFRRDPFRLLPRRQRPLRGIQEGPFRRAPGDRSRPLGDRLRLSGPARRAASSRRRSRPACRRRHERLRLQHAPGDLRRRARARSDRAAVRLRMGQPQFLLRPLPAHRELFRGLRTLSARAARGRARARIARALSRTRCATTCSTAPGRRRSTDGRAATARRCKRALALFAAAGYELEGTELRERAQRPPFTFEILVTTQGPGAPRARLCARPQARRHHARGCAWSTPCSTIAGCMAYDFDMIQYRWDASLSPGNEQAFYWGSAAAAQRHAATTWA